MTEEKKSDPNWMQNLWRPMMGWMYMLICVLDMAVFPVLWSLLQASMKMPITQWNPLTLQGAGLFHIAMGAVLGIAAFGRTQEKLAGTAANPTATTTNVNMTGNVSGGFGSNQGAMTNNNFGGPSAFGTPSQGSGGFGSSQPGFGAVPPVTNSFGSAPITTTAGGKKIVPQGDDPVL